MRQFRSILPFCCFLFLFCAPRPIMAQGKCPADLLRRVASSDVQNVPWYEAIEFPKIERQLRNTSIRRIYPIKNVLEESGRKAAGSTPVYLVELENGLLAVWKPEVHPYFSQGEVDAYQFAKLVHYQGVPPTVFREFTESALMRAGLTHEELAFGTSGSLQYFIQGAKDLNAKGVDFQKVLSRLNEKELSDKRIFHFVFGQWDYSKNNVAIQSNHLAAIDNGGIIRPVMARYGEPPFVPISWVDGKEAFNSEQPFPFGKAVLLKGLDRSKPQIDLVHKALKGALSKKYIQSHWRWIAKGDVKIVLWNERPWIAYQRDPNEFDLPYTTVFSNSTLSYYRRLSRAQLKRVAPNLPAPMIQQILNRRDQILAAARRGRHIP